MKEDLKLIVETYMSSGSIKEVSRCTGLSHSKIRKILLSAGVKPDNPRTTQIQDLYSSGMSIEDIAHELKISTKAVNAHLPYTRKGYKPEDKPPKKQNICPVCNSNFLKSKKQCCISARHEYINNRNKERKNKNICPTCGKKAGMNPKTGKYYTLCNTCREKRREYNRRPEVKEKLKETFAKYKLEKKEERDEYNREYRLKNKERIAAYCREYYIRKKQAKVIDNELPNEPPS